MESFKFLGRKTCTSYPLLCGLSINHRMITTEQLEHICVGTNFWELIYRLLVLQVYFHSLKQTRLCVFKRVFGSSLTFSSSDNSFSNTGEDGLFFMKSLKLLDLCRLSCKHTQNTRILSGSGKTMVPKLEQDCPSNPD